MTVNTIFSIDANAGLSQDQITEFKNAISSQLNSTLQTSSGGTMSRSVTFNGGDGNGRLVPSVSLYTGGDPTIGGMNSFGSASVNLYKNDGTLKIQGDIMSIFRTIGLIRRGKMFQEKNRRIKSLGNDPLCHLQEANLVGMIRKLKMPGKEEMYFVSYG